MGSGQSIQLQGATEELLGRTGRFSLRADQKMAHERMAQLLSLILERNNLFDLEEILKEPLKCNKLMVVVGSLIKKEFQTLRLPDPSARGEALPVSFMTKSQYQVAESSDKTRAAMCDSIAWFILRFCTLITGLIASVRINDQMASYITSASAASFSPTMNPNFTDPILPETLEAILRLRRSMNSDIVNDLVQNKTLHKVLLENKKPDARPIYSVSDEYTTFSFVLNTKTQCIYKSFKVAETQIFGIEIRIVEPIELPGEERRRDPYVDRGAYGDRRPYDDPRSTNVEPAHSRAPTVRYAGSTRSNRSDPSLYDRPNTRMPEWNARTATTRGTVPSIFRGRGGNRTRKHKYRMHYGGATTEDKWYQVTLTDLECDTDQCDIVGTFYMNSKAHTVSKEEYGTLLKRERLGKALIIQQFTKRIEDVFKNQNRKKYLTKPPSETGSLTGKQGDFAPINKASEESYQKLKALQQAMSVSSYGISPAQYRAYLLATSIDAATATADGKSRGLHTRFCKDSWEKVDKATSIAAYALLEALYNDRPDGIREALTQDTLLRDVNSFIGEKLLIGVAASGAKVGSFGNVKFAETPPELKEAFCKQVVPPNPETNSGDRVTRQETDVTILMNAHKELRKLYDEQLQAVFNNLVTLMSAKSTGYSTAPQLLLHEDFSRDPRGALVVLEERIAKARNLLVNHYKAVERVYRNALLALKQRVQGVYNSGRKL